VTIWEESGAGIWILDVARQVLTRLTPSDGSEAGIWTPDGREVTYRSPRDGAFNLFSQAADGSRPAQRLTVSTADQCPSSWSPDGRMLTFIEDDPPTSPDIRILSREGLVARPLVNSPFGEWDGILSPDGRLVAYASMESGRLEVYLRPHPGPGAKQQVSTEGGNSPVWSHSGKELFYLNGRKVMAVPLAAVAHTVGRPVLLFEGEYNVAGSVANFDVTPDGEGFVMVRGEGPTLPWVQGHVLTNWLDDLERRSPVAR
jgi:Tol biopolymer transport system component